MKELDYRGLKCPLPVMLFKKEWRKTKEQTVFRLVTDDEMARIDIPFFCQQENLEIMSQNNDAEITIFEICVPAKKA